MNQQIQKRQASALDRAKAALAHGAHAIDSSDVSELIQELEKLMAERKADDVREQRKKSAAAAAMPVAEAVWRLMETPSAHEILSRCLHGDLIGTEEAVIWVTMSEQARLSNTLPEEISFTENYEKIVQGKGACSRDRIRLMLKGFRC